MNRYIKFADECNKLHPVLCPEDTAVSRSAVYIEPADKFDAAIMGTIYDPVHNRTRIAYSQERLIAGLLGANPGWTRETADEWIHTEALRIFTYDPRVGVAPILVVD